MRSYSALTLSKLGVFRSPLGLVISGTREYSTISGAGSDQGRDFGIPEFPQNTKQIAIDRLGPDLLARVEVTADERSVDAWIGRRRIEGDQPAFAVSGNTDLLCLPAFACANQSTAASTFWTS